MSNTRKARWSEAQIDAGNAERLLSEFMAEGEAFAARTVIMRDLVARYCVTDPGTVAAMEQAAMELGDDYWVSEYRRIVDRN